MKSGSTYTMTFVLISCIVFVVLCSMQAEAISCDSCGRECASACGTRHFRTCCFNYLRKRSGPAIPRPDLKLDLYLTTRQLARTLNNLNERNYADWRQNEIDDTLNWREKPIAEEEQPNTRPNESSLAGNKHNADEPNTGRMQLIYDS